MKKEKVVFSFRLNEEEQKSFDQFNDRADFIFGEWNKLTKHEIEDASVIIGNLPLEKLEMVKDLKWLQLNSAGTEPYSNSGVLADDVILTNSTGAYGQAVSEHGFAMLFSLMKKLHLYRDNQNIGKWESEGRVVTLRNKTVLVLGLGDIGEHFAELVRPFGCKIIGINSSGKKNDKADEVYSLAELDEILPNADIIFSSLPENSETIGLFNGERFKLMKSSSFLINVGRGSVVVTDALCDAVENGEIAGAGIDVLEIEPLPSNHRLWDIKNIIITPHISGYFHLAETKRRILDIVRYNLEAYLNGGKLKNTVIR
ncbi:MAG: D-2-hydroxyacid dehydrogenase [Tissierellia bacterium]|nr:D-2-hydroxyacid dehydrogenase [Tissierellia bacterium]